MNTLADINLGTRNFEVYERIGIEMLWYMSCQE